jgi:hypothetical protein
LVFGEISVKASVPPSVSGIYIKREEDSSVRRPKPSIHACRGDIQSRVIVGEKQFQLEILEGFISEIEETEDVEHA